MLTLLSILQILLFTFMFSVGLVYTELQENDNVSLLEGLTLILILVEILVNLFTIKHHSGKKL